MLSVIVILFFYQSQFRLNKTNSDPYNVAVPFSSAPLITTSHVHHLCDSSVQLQENLLPSTPSGTTETLQPTLQYISSVGCYMFQSVQDREQPGLEKPCKQPNLPKIKTEESLQMSTEEAEWSMNQVFLHQDKTSLFLSNNILKFNSTLKVSQVETDDRVKMSRVSEDEKSLLSLKL